MFNPDHSANTPPLTSDAGSPALPTTPAQVSDLIRRVAQKDRSAFTELYHATAPKLLGTVLRILQNRGWAEDVVQEVYVKVWQKAEQFDPGKASPITWLVTIARNRAIDEARRQPAGARVADDALDQIASTAPDGPASLETHQSVERLNGCLEQLQRDRRDMVRLAYLNGWSRNELSAHFEQPVNTVKTWLHRALKQLRECLTP